MSDPFGYPVPESFGRMDSRKRVMVYAAQRGIHVTRIESWGVEHQLTPRQQRRVRYCRTRPISAKHVPF